MATQTVAIGVGGRFHSDFLFNALLGYGYNCRLFTSLPKQKVPHVPRHHIENYIFPELCFRAGKQLGFEHWGDKQKMQYFGNWLSKQVKQYKADTLICWSSFAKESFENKSTDRCILIRDSTHIRHQYEVLKREYQKYQLPFPQRQFCLERELREYDLADEIIVLSDYAKETFVKEGIAHKKLHVLRLGVDTNLFYPPQDVVKPSGPLKIIYFGILSPRKGISYLLEASKAFKNNEIELHLIGGIDPVIKDELNKYQNIHLHSPRPQKELIPLLQTMEVFVFPTIEDGFGQTLPQSLAVGLYPIVTKACGAGEQIRTQEEGTIVPERDASAIEKAIRWCLENRDEISQTRMLRVKASSRYNWAQYGATLNQILQFSPITGTIELNDSQVKPSL